LGKKQVRLTVADYGCPSETVEYNFNVIDCTVETTNVFTPDGDGQNDSFIIDMIAYNPNSQLTIYNRWGRVVYHSDNYQNDWRGENTNGGGVYYYTLLLVDGSSYHGMVTVMK
jgi:gliding motility-associated-like protein